MKNVYQFNYLYKLTLISDPRFYYYGIRSTNTAPELDRYKGSGRALEKFKKQGLEFRKEILGNYKTREEVELEEEKIVGSLWKTDPFCLNRSKGGQKGGKFDASGLYRVFRNTECRLIDPDALQQFEQEGWKRGVPLELKQKLSSIWKGSHRDPEIVEKIQATKRLRGNTKHSEETKQKISKANKGRKYGKEYRDRIRTQKEGTIWIRNETTQKLVKKEKVNTYLEKGWFLGKFPKTKESREKSAIASKNLWKNPEFRNKQISARLGKKLSEETRKKLSEATKGKPKGKGRVHIYRNSERKMVWKQEVEEYLRQGWILGRPKRSA